MDAREQHLVRRAEDVVRPVAVVRMLYKDEDRFIETYSDKFGLDTYTVGDAARRDEDGYSGSSGALEEKVSERQSEDEE